MTIHDTYRSLVRAKMRALMGRHPTGWNRVGSYRHDSKIGCAGGSGRAPKIKTIGMDTIRGIERRRIRFLSEADDWVPAVVLLPPKRESPSPGVVCLHQTTRIGKDEPAGYGGNDDLHYALELAERGYVTIAPDYPGFGEYETDPYDLGYQSTTMKGIYNHQSAIDVLHSMREVDRTSIGCIGHSLGGHNALFLAAYDERINVVVTSCGFTSFHRYKNGNIAPWSQEKYMPLVENRYGNDPERMPFDFIDILSAVAPRSIFVNAPTGDDNFNVRGVRDIIDSVSRLYARLGAESRMTAVYPQTEHSFPSDIRRRAYDHISRHIGPEDARLLIS